MSGRFEIDASSTQVGAWSDVRLAFEPRDASARAFRDELRVAIGRLLRAPVLRAVYQSADSFPCDAENVALYNVGAAAFAGLGNELLLVERPRGFSPRAPSGEPLAHYLGYEALGAPIDWRSWRPHGMLVTWRSAPVQGELAATSVWRALKSGAVTVHRRWDGQRQLGVIVRYGGSRTLVSAVKALVDGVVSAGHFIEGDDVAELGSLVSNSLGTRPQTATAWLTDRGAGVLGPRQLVVPRAGKFQWNPADDRVAAIRVERSAADIVEAELWTLAPVVPD